MKKYYSKINRNMLKILMLGIVFIAIAYVLLSKSDMHLFQYFTANDDLLDFHDVQLEEEKWYRSANQQFVGSYGGDDEGVYYIGIISNSKDEINYMGYYVYNKDVEKADAIIDATYDLYDNGIQAESLNFLSYRGYVYDMNETERQYFIEAFEDSGYDKETIDALCYKTFYPVSAGEILKTYVKTETGRFVGVLILTIFGLWGIMSYTSRKRQVKKAIAVNHLNEDSIAYDLDGGVYVQKMQIGKKYALFMGVRPALIILDQMIWAYLHVTTTKHYYAFIPMGKSKSYELEIVMSDGKKRSIRVRSEEEGHEILEYLQEAAPAAIYGYSDSLAKLNFSSLVNMVNRRRMEIAQQEMSSSGPEAPAQDTQSGQGKSWEDTLVDLNLYDTQKRKTEEELNPMERMKNQLSNINWNE